MTPPQPIAAPRAEPAALASSHGLLFPQIPALIARDADGFLLLASSGLRARITGPICRDIERSLAAGAATPELRRLVPAHAALAHLAAWLDTPAVPLSRDGAVRLDGFDTLFIELLGRCNERCVHCYADSAPTVTDALDQGVVFAMIDEAAAAGFRRIQFTGGDPLLCEFLPEAVAHAAARGIPHLEIYTNGLALTDELLGKLAPHRPSFAFSVYSADPEIHDRTTRTPGSHRRTLAAIDRVVARGLSCRAAAVVLEPGDDVDALIDMLRGRGVKSVTWTRAFAVGRGSEVAEASQAATAPLVDRPSPRVAEGGGHTAPGERAGLGKLCVTYTGDVVPCIFQRGSVLGNVRGGTSLAALLAERPPERRGRRGLPTVDDTRQRLQCASCRLTDLALAWLDTRAGSER
jgi:MoaA/NifB/PqqE/SkfB family radical SAM enzyme